MQWTITEENDGMLIRDYLQKVKHFSRRMTKAVKFDGGQILVNSIPRTVGYSLVAGDALTVEFPPEEIGEFMEPADIPLSIVYEDDGVIILNKQAGVATIPSMDHPANTIANGLLAYYKQQSIPYTVHVATRLDRDTSGLLLVAKHRYSHSLISASQQAGEVKRKYIAIVEGCPTDREGTIDAPIGRKEGSIIEREVRESGQRAVTHYKVVRPCRGYALVEVELKTGRTHQIRVHLAYKGHPLVGDTLYGGSFALIGRQALHCKELSFEHPFTKEEMTFSTDIPEDMKHLLK